MQDLLPQQPLWWKSDEKTVRVHTHQGLVSSRHRSSWRALAIPTGRYLSQWHSFKGTPQTARRLNIKLPDDTGTQPQLLLFVDDMAEQPQIFREKWSCGSLWVCWKAQRPVVLPAFLIYAAKNELAQIILHISHPQWDGKRPPISYLRPLHSWKNLCLRTLDVFLFIKFHSRDKWKCFIWNNFLRDNLTEPQSYRTSIQIIYLYPPCVRKIIP